jgi:hypothetical protein
MARTALHVDPTRPGAGRDGDGDPGEGHPADSGDAGDPGHTYSLTRTPRRPGRRRLLAGLGILAVAAVAAAIVVATRDSGSGDAAATKSTTTAKVQRRTLVRSQSVDGTLDFGEEHPVTAGRAGTVTSVAAEGTVVDRGQALFAVDRRPTELLLGSLPFYRDLAAGVDDGPDVQQLEQNLSALSFTDGGTLTVDDHFDAHTTAAVEDWQTKLGVDDTGKVAQGDVVFRPAAVRVSSISADVGAPVQATSTVVAVTARTQVVRLGLDAGQADLAKVGVPVRVALPDGSSVTGKVTAVADASSASGSGSGSGSTSGSGGSSQSSEATSGGGGGSGGGSGGSNSGSSSTAVVNVTVSLDNPKAVASYTTASVDVDFTTERKPDVLAVPVTALLALAGGGYAVEVPQAGGTTRLVSVQAGMYADGYVEVSGAGLTAGTAVVVAK